MKQYTEKEISILKEEIYKSLTDSIINKIDKFDIAESIGDILWNYFGDEIDIDDYGDIENAIVKIVNVSLFRYNHGIDVCFSKIINEVLKYIYPKEKKEPGMMKDVTDEQFNELELLLIEKIDELVSFKVDISDLIEETEDVIWEYLGDRLYKYADLELEMNRLINDEMAVYETGSKQTATEIIKVLKQLRADEIKGI